ncbi:MAG: type II toxin-antitoxin system RelE/ParE family toxin [Gammaproteobacteria bacterium]
MISRFRHKGLERFFKASDYRGIPAQHAPRIERMLDRLDGALRAQDMNLPGYGFHPLKGERRGTYAVSVSGNRRMTFRFEGEHAVDVDLEDYH